MRQTLRIGITALAIAALTMSGIALALDDTDADTAGTDVTLEQADAVQGIGAELEALIEDGTITEDQAEAIEGVLAECGTGGHHRFGGHGVEAAAEFLGITVEDIRAAFEDGSTLADVAAANGSSADALVTELVSQAEERLDQAIEDGNLDAADRDEKLAEITDRVTDMVNGERPEGGFGPGGHRGGPRGGPGQEAPTDG
ncbi:hypothetical protein HQ535_06465 [bacterium]|nr:hypothetical protein [bacterium]